MRPDLRCAGPACRQVSLVICTAAILLFGGRTMVNAQQVIPEISSTQSVPLRPRQGTAPPAVTRPPISIAPMRLATGSPQSASGPSGQWPSTNVDVTLVAKSLSLVLGLFFGFLWILRIRGNAAQQDAVFEHLGTHALVNRHRVHVVRVGGRLLLLTQQGKQLKPLTEITDPLEVEQIADACRNSRHRSSRPVKFPEDVTMVRQAIQEVRRT